MDEITSSIDRSDPEVKKLYNLPIIGALFREPKKSNQSNQSKEKGIFVTGIDMIDNTFKAIPEEDTSMRYYNSAEFDYGETVNEKISGMPVIDAYITLLGGIVIFGLTLFIIWFTISKLT